MTVHLVVVKKTVLGNRLEVAEVMERVSSSAIVSDIKVLRGNCFHPEESSILTSSFSNKNTT